jgi:hypothetical protein
MSVTIDFDTVLSVARAAFIVLACVFAAIAFTRWRRAAAQDAERISNQLSAVTERLAEIEAGLALLDSRISEINRTVETPHKAPALPASNASPSYPIAIRLARNGASLEELMESCGLARQEAELVKRLHGPQKRTVRAQSAAA